MPGMLEENNDDGLIFRGVWLSVSDLVLAGASCQSMITGHAESSEESESPSVYSGPAATCEAESAGARL